MHNEKWRNVPQGRPVRNKFAHESENINTMSQVQVQDASAKVIIKPSQNNRMPHFHKKGHLHSRVQNGVNRIFYNARHGNLQLKIIIVQLLHTNGNEQGIVA